MKFLYISLIPISALLLMQTMEAGYVRGYATSGPTARPTENLEPATRPTENQGHSARPTGNPDFEFWNKTNQPIYYSLGKAGEQARSQTLKKLYPNGFISDNTGNRPIELLFSTESPTATKPRTVAQLYKFEPGKTIYIRVKEENGRLIFGPQTGPLLGFLGKTERGYPLSNNVKQQDVTRASQGQIEYQPSGPPIEQRFPTPSAPPFEQQQFPQPSAPPLEQPQFPKPSAPPLESRPTLQPTENIPTAIKEQPIQSKIPKKVLLPEPRSDYKTLVELVSSLKKSSPSEIFGVDPLRTSATTAAREATKTYNQAFDTLNGLRQTLPQSSWNLIDEAIDLYKKAQKVLSDLAEDEQLLLISGSTARKTL